jgi:small subunit ribosomal protein S17
MNESRGKRRVLQGVVMSTAMDKSITVRVEQRYKHSKYGKYLSAHKKYMAHDEEGQAGVGDIVQISESRPVSKRKRWRLVEVVTQATVTDGKAIASDGGVL